MNRKTRTVMLGFLLALGASSALSQENEVVTFSTDEIKQIHALSPLPAIPSSPTNSYADDPKAAHFGQLLFFEPRLSANGEISCASCHSPLLGFSDGLSHSKGLGTTDRNSPTLLNLAWQRWYFWDGRADSMWAQAIQPLLRKNEMGSTPQKMLTLISSDSVLRNAYESVFGPVPKVSDPVEPNLDRFLSYIGKSLEAYQRQLISKDSLFDRFVTAGIGKNNSPISKSAQRGLLLFIGKGKCSLCHSGPNFSDGEFHNIGLQKPPGNKADTGRFKGIRELKADRFNGTGVFSDDRSSKTNEKIRYVVQKMNNLSEFKTPTLRDIKQTAPYMHDGRFSTLREVLDYYSELPGEPKFGHREETLVPLNLTENEKVDLEEFLKTLDGTPIDPALIGQRK